MLRSVAHDMLSRRDRKARHLAVAAHLRTAFPDDGAEVVEVLATHYHDAYLAASGDDDADGVRAEAATAFERAGMRAGSLGSPEAAEKHYRSAAELAVDEVDQLRLIEAAAKMSRRAGRSRDALDLYEHAAARHRAAGRLVEAARLGAGIGPLLTLTGRSADGMRVMQEALDLLEKEGAEEASAELHGALGEILMRGANDRIAEVHIERAIDSATALELPLVLLNALHSKAWLLTRHHRIVEATALYSASTSVAQDKDLPSVEAVSRGNLAEVQAQSDLPGVRSEGEQSLALFARLGDPEGQAISLLNLAMFHFYTGDWAATADRANQAIAVSPLERIQTFGRAPLVLLLCARGDPTGARSYLDGLDSLASSDDAQDRALLGIAESALAMSENRFGDALLVAAEAAADSASVNGFRSEGFRLAWPMAIEAALLSDRLDEARSQLAVVADAPPGHVPPYIRAQLVRFRALIAMAEGSTDPDIEADLRSAVDAFRDLSYRYWLARGLADLGGCLIGHGRADETKPLLTQARDILSELGAQPDLERVNAVMASAIGPERTVLNGSAAMIDLRAGAEAPPQ